MSLNLSAFAVRERAVTLFFILLLAAGGTYAFFTLGRAEDPNFTIQTLTVTTAWPGATAREMQDLVAEPLEKRLQELTWYDRVETTTRPGYAYMTLTLKDSTPPSAVQEEFYQARKKLGDEARNLPPGVLGPFVNDEYSDVSFALYALKAKGMPMRELARQAEVIRQDLLHVPGVKKIKLSAHSGTEVAEGVGFEPTLRFPVNTLSKRAPSATRPSLRTAFVRNRHSRLAPGGIRIQAREMQGAKSDRSRRSTAVEPVR